MVLLLMSKYDILLVRHLSDKVGGVKLIFRADGNASQEGHIIMSGAGLPSASGCKEPEFVQR